MSNETAQGLTWDHPRGYQALERLSEDRRRQGEAAIRWARQPLEGFESAPIDELAARYDVLVLDHPHLGDALAVDCLQPLDAVFTANELAGWRDQSIGASFTSYTLGGRPFALPLDAASQVMAHRPGIEPPSTYEDVLSAAARCRVTLSLAGPHALLTVMSALVAQGTPPAVAPDADSLFDAAAFAEVWPLLAGLYRASVPTDLNPIGILEAMRDGEVDLCPLVFGYVPYASGTPPVHFVDAPRWTASGPIGSVLGGTGLALTRRAAVSDALLDEIRTLMGLAAQTGLVPDEAGQPSARAAWTDPGIDARAGGFYGGTRETLEAAWVRPRWAGYVPFQTRASACVRQALADGWTADAARQAIEDLWRQAVSPLR